MTTGKIDQLLEGAVETYRFEVKGAMEWDRIGLAKDILAMANTQDGGIIVIGVEDETYVRQGLTAKQIETFIPDQMHDQMAEYADPEVIFTVTMPSDQAGRKYVLIDVQEFQEMPVICKKDGWKSGAKKPEFVAGTIYHRPRAGKARSARISNPTDMRNIIERAIAKRGSRLREIGFVPVNGATAAYDAELGDL